MICICSHLINEHGKDDELDNCSICPCPDFTLRPIKHKFKVDREKTEEDPQYIHFECDCGAEDMIWRNTWRAIVGRGVNLWVA